MQKNQNSIIYFKEIVKRRKSWKAFAKKIISDDIIHSIIEDASYSPSSFGLNPWKVLVIKNSNLKTQLEPYCDFQEQVPTCSHLLVVLSYKTAMFHESASWMINRSMQKRNLKTKAEYETFYHQRFLRYMNQIKDWNEWSIRQAYILLQSILLSAAAHQVDSCPMEGIDAKGIINFLETNALIAKDTYNCPFVIALGYHQTGANTKQKSRDETTDQFIFIP